MKRIILAALVGISVISGCVRDTGLPVPTPSPKAAASDSDWIRKLDAKSMEIQWETMLSHTASYESLMLLWLSLECRRDVYIGKARATELISVRKGISRKDASKEINADPRWIIAMQGCER